MLWPQVHCSCQLSFLTGQCVRGGSQASTHMKAGRCGLAISHGDSLHYKSPWDFADLFLFLLCMNVLPSCV